MGLKFFKRAKVENSVDFENMMVELPKTKKEVALTTIINEYDAIQNMNGYANGDHMVKVGEKDEMSVNDLVKKHLEMCNEMESMKTAKNDVDGGEPGGENEEEEESMDNEALDIDQMGDVGDRGGDVHLNEDDEDVEGDKKKKDKMKNEADKKAAVKAKAARLKNAHRNLENEQEVRISLPMDQVARGIARYGSGR